MSATTRDVIDRRPRYDRATIAFHWWTAGMLAVMWVLAEVIDLGPTRDARIYIRSIHIVLGFVLLAVVAARIGWRITQGRRLPSADAGPLKVLAKATHYGLYLLVGTQLVSGVVYTFARGDNVFNLFRLPMVMTASFDLQDVSGNIHALTATIILVLAGLHMSAALVHQFWWRDGLLRRMWVT